jgi:hypothetical protein
LLYLPFTSLKPRTDPLIPVDPELWGKRRLARSKRENSKRVGGVGGSLNQQPSLINDSATEPNTRPIETRWKQKGKAISLFDYTA